MAESNESKLKAAITAALEANGDLADAEIAASVGADAYDIVWAWALERLTVLVRAERRKQPDPNQLSLPFADLHIRVPVHDGFIHLRDATIGKLRDWADQLRRKRIAVAKRDASPNTMLGRLERLIRGMNPYSIANRRLTVQSYYEMVARGTPPPEYQDRMSAAMKRYWDQMSPGERSDVAYRRARKRWAKKAKKAAK